MIKNIFKFIEYVLNSVKETYFSDKENCLKKDTSSSLV